MDFWLLGGASVMLFGIMYMASFFRENSPVIQNKFFMFGSLFALSSAICNYPHFMITFRFGYSRGWRFLLKYWFSLIVIPLILFSTFAFSYVYYDQDISNVSFVGSLNGFFRQLGLTFRIGETQTLGPALLGVGIWAMYCTVGWHYSKQVYGCMMVYNHYDNYGLTRFQKLWIKYSLLFLGLYQFFYASAGIDRDANAGFRDPRFAGVNLSPMGLPVWAFSMSQFLMIFSFMGTISILIFLFYKRKKIPSPTFLISWIALYVWWIQLTNLPEFYFMAVPFFHSLQYLPFAAKMENKKIPINALYFVNITARLLLLVFVGLMFFEFIPGYLDQRLDTGTHQTAWFFMTAFAVFINIHHFFIDSTVWRFEQQEVKLGILKS